MKFAEILGDLIIESGLSKRKVALGCHITTSQMASFLRGAIPSVASAVRIACYFNCSLNYLMGLDEQKDQTKIIRKDYDFDGFLDRYNKMLESNNITHWKLCQNIDISESVGRGWRKGAEPKLESLLKIANYLNCSIDYLLDRAKS